MTTAIYTLYRESSLYRYGRAHRDATF